MKKQTELQKKAFEASLILYGLSIQFQQRQLLSLNRPFFPNRYLMKTVPKFVEGSGTN